MILKVRTHSDKWSNELDTAAYNAYSKGCRQHSILKRKQSVGESCEFFKCAVGNKERSAYYGKFQEFYNYLKYWFDNSKFGYKII